LLAQRPGAGVNLAIVSHGNPFRAVAGGRYLAEVSRSDSDLTDTRARNQPQAMQKAVTSLRVVDGRY
jgi:hypothetical protein